MLYLVTLLAALYSSTRAGDSGCTTTVDYNIQFLIDESGSVQRDGYDMSVDFVNNLITDDISEDAPISILEFSANVDLIYRFDQTQLPRSIMTNALSGSSWDASTTNTAAAVQAAINEYERAQDDGDLVDGDRLLLLLTDGKPCCDASANPCGLKTALDALDITVILIGVGDFDRDNVDCLASNDRDSIIEVADFTAEAFDTLEEQLAVTTCPPPDDGCETTAEYSVQFLIDESGSVPEDGYELSIDLVQDLIRDDISPQAKISVFEFASGVQTIYRFNQLQNPRQPMINVIESAVYNSGVTNTYAAVNDGINEFRRALTDGDIDAADPKLLVLLTDGKPCCTPAANPCPLKSDLDDLGIQVIIIGVGSFDRTNVDCLAVNDDDSVIEVEDFTAEAFTAVEDEIAETTCPDDEIVRPPGNKICEEAQKFCKDTYGTNLATIITDEDRANAQAALAATSEPYAFIGLYSDDIETKWQYRSGATCPSDSAYRCVDFWRTAPGGFENRPRCIGDGEGGYGCAVIYADDGKVDNDIPDFIPQPFLCDAA